MPIQVVSSENSSAEHEILDIVSANELNQLAHGDFGLRREQHVNMVGHQHVRMNLTSVLFGPCPESFKIEVVVSLVSEDRRAVITALDHMLRLAGKGKSRKPGHLRIPAG